MEISDLPSRLRTFSLLVSIVICALSLTAGTQQPALCDRPMGFTDIVDLTSGTVPMERIRQLIETCGVDFALTPDLEGQLRSLGATDLVITAMRRKADSKQEATPVYVIRTRQICDSRTALFSAPAFPSEGNGSFETARLRDGDVGTLLEQTQDKLARIWYRIRLPNGTTGWSNQGCAELRIGGTDPRVFLTLITPTGNKSDGYLRIRQRTDTDASEQDDGVVTTGDFLDFADNEIGMTKLRWEEVESVIVNGSQTDRTAEIVAVRGNRYTTIAPIGLVNTSRKIQIGFQVYRDQRVEISLWLATRDREVKLAALPPGTKLVKLQK